MSFLINHLEGNSIKEPDYPPPDQWDGQKTLEEDGYPFSTELLEVLDALRQLVSCMCVK